MKKLILILLALSYISMAATRTERCAVTDSDGVYHFETCEVFDEEATQDSIQAYKDSVKAYKDSIAILNKIYNDCGNRHNRKVYQEDGYVYEETYNRTNWNGTDTEKVDGQMLYRRTFKKLNNKSVRVTTKEWFYSNNGYITTNTITKVFTFEEVVDECSKSPPKKNW